MKPSIKRSLAIATATVLVAGAVDAGGRDEMPDLGLEIRYRVTLLPALGGSVSVARGINNRGWVTGRSHLPGDRMQHAVLWRNGRPIDLGTLGGPNSSVMWPSKNVRGLVAGITQTAEPDPYDEVWSCGFFFPAATATGHRCVGFAWENGRMRELPTLGGTHGFATGANNLRQIVGWAENTVRDPTCEPPQVLQFRAVLWGPGHDQLRELPPLPGHSVSAATAINDRGQVVGISGVCDQAAGRRSAISSVLWENGEPIEIGDLGGVAWNTPMAINQRGDVVGFANASADDGNAFNPRAFLWIRGKPVRNLGMLDGDDDSQATGINVRRQVVGTSCGADGCRAFLWHNGTMQDLNALVSVPDSMVLTVANDIDDLGRISGQAFDAATSGTRAFVATPYLAIRR